MSCRRRSLIVTGRVPNRPSCAAGAAEALRGARQLSANTTGPGRQTTPGRTGWEWLHAVSVEVTVVCPVRPVAVTVLHPAFEQLGGVHFT